MESICGVECCECNFKAQCKGCTATNGKPFGGACVAAEQILKGGKESFEAFKKQIIDELNDLNIENMPKITSLVSLCGFFVNLTYPLPNGTECSFLDDKNIYLGAQVESEEKNEQRCFGVVADKDFLLVCRYGENGSNPELICYRKR
ncbi:MAG TPA: hypothetical protein DDY98_03770 [Ruminococcaceae bacterium]|nr:hypothetical protein [Oscillospiraceae bacterium]